MFYAQPAKPHPAADGQPVAPTAAPLPRGGRAAKASLRLLRDQSCPLPAPMREGRGPEPSLWRKRDGPGALAGGRDSCILVHILQKVLNDRAKFCYTKNDAEVLRCLE